MRTLLSCGYSTDDGADLHLLSMNETGHLTCLWSERRGDSPSFIARHDDTYYLACEMPDYARVAAYKLDHGSMREVAAITVPGESGLCHLLDTPWGIACSCYGSGSFFMVDHDLSKVIWRDHRSAGSHGHCAALWNDHLLLVDLDLDCVDTVSSDGAMVSRLQLPQGIEPRQLLWTSPDRMMLVCEAGDCLIPIHIAHDQLTAEDKIQLAAQGFPATACLAPDGTVIVPVRGSDQLVMLSSGQQVTIPLKGQWPRFSAWIGGYLLVCLQRSNELQVYRRETKQLALLDTYPMGGAACVIPIGE
jgi:6-phosphogluconolactonase (cycloisomerase 2 family)